MRAMVLSQIGAGHVDAVEIDKPAPGAGDVLVKVLACGVCRTDLHVVDGDLRHPTIPIVPGHEIVGRVEAVGRDVTTHTPGERVGIPWLGWSCRACEFCRAGRGKICVLVGDTPDTRSTAAMPSTRSPMHRSASHSQRNTTMHTSPHFFVRG